MSYSVELTTVESFILAAVRRTATFNDLDKVVTDGLSTVWEFVNREGLPHTGTNVVVYRDELTNFECGVQVLAPFTGQGTVFCGTTPAGPAAMVAHLGPYQSLPEAHSFLRHWCRTHQRILAGPCWEVYGHWTEDPAQRRTDVYYLLTE